LVKNKKETAVKQTNKKRNEGNQGALDASTASTKATANLYGIDENYI
jgi:hypothetical protein